MIVKKFIIPRENGYEKCEILREGRFLFLKRRNFYVTDTWWDEEGNGFQEYKELRPDTFIIYSMKVSENCIEIGIRKNPSLNIGEVWETMDKQIKVYPVVPFPFSDKEEWDV